MIDSLVHELAAGARGGGGRRASGFEEGRYALVTLHRPSNVDDPGRLGALLDFLGERARELPVVFPVHPRTRARAREFGLDECLAGVAGLRCLDPIGYRGPVGLMVGARYVLTDSGGVQEESTFLGVPCLTLRPNTERPVTVTLGTNTVVGADLDLARELVGQILGGRYKRGGPCPLGRPPRHQRGRRAGEAMGRGPSRVSSPAPGD